MLPFETYIGVIGISGPDQQEAKSRTRIIAGTGVDRDIDARPFHYKRGSQRRS